MGMTENTDTIIRAFEHTVIAPGVLSGFHKGGGFILGEANLKNIATILYKN